MAEKIPAARLPDALTAPSLVRWLAGLLIAMLAPGTGLAADPVQKTFESRGNQRTYSEFVPDSLPADTAVPLLIVLHGSGGRGRYMVQQWQEMARQKGFIVVGPDSSDIMSWRLREDSPVIFRDMVVAIARERPIDTRRLYLFGQSGGAVYALTLSMLESEFFAAVAVHAGSWRDKNAFAALITARRKIPVAIFVGDRDPYFSVTSVNRTIDAMKQAGHPTFLQIIKRHAHSYQEVAADMNPTAWDFMQATSLAENAKFLEYE